MCNAIYQWNISILILLLKMPTPDYYLSLNGTLPPLRNVISFLLLLILLLPSSVLSPNTTQICFIFSSHTQSKLCLTLFIITRSRTYDLPSISIDIHYIIDIRFYLILNFCLIHSTFYWKIAFHNLFQLYINVVFS